MKKLDDKKQYIFCCYTVDHGEDWFIQAESKNAAKEAHAAFEGFDEDEVKARQICEVPKALHVKASQWPSVAKLKKLGFELLQNDQPRIVRYNGKLFKEGTMMEIFHDFDLLKKTLVYLMHMRGQDHYKIGFSENVSRRKQELSNNSPYHLDILETIITPYARMLEGRIRDHFKKFISATEWVMLDNWASSVLHAVFHLYRL